MTELGNLFKTRVMHRGNGEGEVRLIYKNDNDNLYDFFIPYKFLHSPSGHRLKFQFDDFESEPQEFEDELPERVENDTKDLRSEVRNEANY